MFKICNSGNHYNTPKITIMIDNTKFLTYNQTVINRLLQHPDFEECKPKTNNYYSKKHSMYGVKMSLDFRKAMENGKIIGYRHLELNTSPHYHYNQYHHNGNDFTATDCARTLNDILTYLGIQPQEFEELNVCNIEFGLNIIPEVDIKTLIDGLFYYKKTPFKTGDFPYFKKTDATSYKQIKVYAKGLQFADIPQYGINPNTFRFEVKSKQAKYIKELGIRSSVNLLNLETYSKLEQALVDEWEQILLINLEPKTDDLKGLKEDEVQFIKNAKSFDFWSDLIEQKHRNTFGGNKLKYHKIFKRKGNLHTQIKGQIIDKLLQFQKCANSTQRTPINREKDTFEKTPSKLINLEYAHLHLCLVTGLDISMQKKGSKFLSLTGLKYYRENKIEIYKDLEKKYLTEKMRVRTIEEQMYYIAHNIRNRGYNSKYNPVNKRKKLESNNYNEN